MKQQIMDLLNIEVPYKDEDIDLSLSPSKRFERRLGKYRCHQSNCMGTYKNGHNEMCEQQNHETSILQLKLKFDSKQKRTNKRGSKKLQNTITSNKNPLSPMQQVWSHNNEIIPLVRLETPSSTITHEAFQYPVALAIKSELTDIILQQTSDDNREEILNHHSSNSNEFADLDFSGIASLVGNNTNIGPELINFDELPVNLYPNVPHFRPLLNQQQQIAQWNARRLMQQNFYYNFSNCPQFP